MPEHRHGSGESTEVCDWNNLSFGAFLGKLDFKLAKHGPFLQTRGVSGAACCFSTMACCSQSGSPCSLHGELAELRTAV